MIDAESKLNLEADVVAVRDFMAANGGDVTESEKEPGVYWLSLRPRRQPNELFIARVAWQRYPQQPPSLKFADGVGGSLHVTRAWPLIAGYRPSSFDICKPFTAEGYALHAEWRSGAFAWREMGNPFLWVATQLQDDFNYSFQGRST
jgi:hypothetical protein